MARYYENNDRDFHHCDNCDKYFRSPEASLWWCSAYDGSGVAGDDEAEDYVCLAVINLKKMTITKKRIR